MAAAALAIANGANKTHAARQPVLEVNPPQRYPSRTGDGATRVGAARQKPASPSPATRSTSGTSSKLSGEVPLTPWIRNSITGRRAAPLPAELSATVSPTPLNHPTILTGEADALWSHSEEVPAHLPQCGGQGG
jgi:hypothetical protein